MEQFTLVRWNTRCHSPHADGK